MCIFAKYEPASSTGMYKWDYKLDRDYSALNKLNRYLLELKDLKEFVRRYTNHYYVIAPLWAFSKIRRRLKEREFLKGNWSKISFCKIQEEQKERFEPLEDRVKTYYMKEMTLLEDFEFINDNYREWRNLYIFVSEYELNIDEVNSVFSQIAFFNFSNSLLDYLVLKNIGFINLEMYFFHEEHSYEGKDEEILMYYCPWKLTK